MSLDALADINGPVQQSRVGRLLLAELEQDAALAAQVYAEVLQDPRGALVANAALISALVVGLVDEYRSRGVDLATLPGELRRLVAQLEESIHG